MDVRHHFHQHLHSQNVSYFTFFSELHRSRRYGLVMAAVETLALVAVFLLSVAANVGAMALVSREKRLTNKTLFTLNLFVADLLFVSTIPPIIAARWTVGWRLGCAACQAIMYVICMSGCAAITTLATISLERVLAILRLQTTHSFNSRLVAGALVLIWTFSAVTSMPLSLFFTVIPVLSHEQEDIHICTMLWPDKIGEIVWDAAFTGLGFLAPGAVIVMSYSKILQISKRSRRRLVPTGRNSLMYPVSRQDYKLFRTLFALMVSFVIMWSPIFILTFLILARNFQISLFISPSVFFWVVAFTLANSALNPILYSLCQFRQGCRRLHCAIDVAPLKRASGANSQEKGPATPRVSVISKND